MRPSRNIFTNKLTRILFVYLLVPLFAANVVYGENLTTDLNNVNQRNTHGYKIAGICFSSVGGACLFSSIPFYVKAAHEGNSKNMIESNILAVVGDCLSIGGFVLGGISLPFYVKHAKLKRATNISLDFSANSINVTCDF